MSGMRFRARNKFACGVAAVALLLTVPALAGETVRFDIKPQSLASALDAFGVQAKRPILFTPDLASGKSSAGLSGTLDTDVALGKLLAGTGLTWREESGTILILRGEASSAPKRMGAELAPGTPTAQSADARSFGGAEEIIVTATKRPEAARSIAGSVSVATAAQLDALGAQSFADYLTRVPGVVFNASIPGLSTVSIRGVSTTNAIDQGQGTTGYFINDVPLTDPYFSVAVPDIDAFDVDNVTVLRGPQGTLFGSASLGGAINYQAAKPNLREFQGRVQATLSGTEHGGMGGGAKAMLNVPVVDDKLAVRGVYVFRQDAGFIDNLGTGKQDSNVTRTRGGRFLVSFTPTDTTRIDYMFLQQTQKTDDGGDAEPQAAGPLQKRSAFLESYKFRTTIHNLRLDQDLGFATLTATATYHSKKQASDSDVTSLFGPLLGPPPTPLVHGGQAAFSKGSTFEIRLASPSGQKFEYLIGFMRDDTRENFINPFTAQGATQRIEAIYAPLFGPGIGQRAAPNDTIYSGTLPFRGQEMAGFGEASYRFDDQWKLTLGGRVFETKASNETTSSGLLQLLTFGQVSQTLVGQQSERGFTPKASLTWTPTQDFMAYALVAKGFRFGGPNINPPDPTFPVPANFRSDSLLNYELGMRANFFDRTLQFDVTGFYVDWSDIQLRVGSPAGLAYAVNAGAARNYGVEAVTSWRPVAGLQLQSSLTYLSATLDEPFNPGAGQAIVPAGTTLPGASKWSLANSVSYRFASLPWTPTALLAHRYVSRAAGPIGQWDVTQGDYNLVDLRLTAQIGAVELTGFVNNIADTRGVTNAWHYPGQPYQQYLVRPRTAGVTVDYRF